MSESYYLGSRRSPTGLSNVYESLGVLLAGRRWALLSVSLTLIGFPNEGSIAFVVFLAVSLAIASVTLGLFVSRLANSPFQVIKFMLIFVVPQILLCGVFDLAAAPGWLKALSQCLPLSDEDTRRVSLRKA